MSYNFCYNQHDKIKVIDYLDFKNILRCSLYGCPDRKQAYVATENKSISWPVPKRTYYYDDHYEQQKLSISTEILVTSLRVGIDVLKTGKKDEELLEHFYTDLTSPSEIRQEIIQFGEVFLETCEDALNSLEVNYIRVGSESMEDEISLALCIWNENTNSQYLMRIRSFGWRVIQLLATLHGWVPQATKAPDSSIRFKKLAKLSPKSGKKRLERYDWRIWQEVSTNPEWSGSYNWRMWQQIGAEDAHNLADALRAAIADITKWIRDPDIIELYFSDEDLVNCIEVANGILTPRIPDAAEFRRQTIELCERFIRFCDGAPFLIS